MLRIELHPQMTESERVAIARYLTRHGQMSAQEWLTALRAFDVLGASTVLLEEQRESFSAIYTRLVDRKYADRFIDQLLAMEMPGEADRLKASVAGRIAPDLTDAGLYRHDHPESRYLLTYCYYWWDAFARGYIFEVQIYRDLERSGVEFIAHDIRNPIERHSRCDLIILGREGDIKTSTYFLAAARTQALHHDFYIIRLYNVVQHRHQIAVLVTENAWHEIDGDTVPAALEEAAGLFPQTVRVKYVEDTLIVVEYSVWKRLLKRRQQEK